MIVDTGSGLVTIHDGDSCVGKFEGLPVSVPDDYSVKQWDDRGEWRSVTVDNWFNSRLL